MKLIERLDSLLSEYKNVFVDKARGIGATEYGIKKTYSIANERNKINTLIVCLNECMLKKIHGKLLREYNIKKSNAVGIISLTLSNESKIYIITYNNLKQFLDCNYIEFDFIFMDEPNSKYSISKIEQQIKNRYKTQLFAVGTGNKNIAYQELISNSPYSTYVKIPWYEIEDTKYLKAVDYAFKNMSKDVFDIEYRCHW